VPSDEVRIFRDYMVNTGTACGFVRVDEATGQVVQCAPIFRKRLVGVSFEVLRKQCQVTELGRYKSLVDVLMDALAGFLASHDEEAASGRVCNCDNCIDGRVAIAQAKDSRE